MCSLKRIYNIQIRQGSGPPFFINWRLFLNPSVAKPTIDPVYQPWGLQTLQSVAGFVVFHHNSTSKPNQLQEYHICVCANLPKKQSQQQWSNPCMKKPWFDKMKFKWNYLTGLWWFFQPKCSDIPTKQRQTCCSVSNSNHCHFWSCSTSPSQQLGWRGAQRQGVHWSKWKSNTSPFKCAIVSFSRVVVEILMI